ncbi:ABC transporter permease [Acuticoccus sp.]|uniref:ABC transporter permease n=1 Tax=Acuticoccus sp. TaxID=1904378 RepID=UPI003B52C225
MPALARLAQLVGTLLAAAVLVFMSMSVLPGDAAQLRLGMNADPEAVAELRRAMGLDRSVPERFVRWLAGAFVGDLGTSSTYDVPVSRLIAERATVSVPLAGLAVTLSVGVALPAGLLAAVRRRRLADRVVSALAQVGLSVPNVWLGLMLIWLFAIVLAATSAGGFPGWDAGLGAGLAALVLPAIALATPQAAILTRLTRTAVVEAMDEDYVALARAKGRSPSGAVVAHALPNAWAPILTVIGLQFGFLLAGGIIIETVFNLPGLGRLLFQAVAQRDVPLVQGIVLVLVAAVIAVNALCDAAAAWTNPKQRREPS